MNRQQAEEAAKQIGVAPGDHIFLQSEYMINNPHQHSNDGAWHHDGFRVENNNGVYDVQKIHSDDR